MGRDGVCACRRVEFDGSEFTQLGGEFYEMRSYRIGEQCAVGKDLSEAVKRMDTGLESFSKKMCSSIFFTCEGNGKVGKPHTIKNDTFWGRIKRFLKC